VFGYTGTAVVKSQHSNSFNPKQLDSPKKTATASGFALLAIPAMLLTLLDKQGTRLGENSRNRPDKWDTPGWR
jgi:hypothetical protein